MIRWLARLVAVLAALLAGMGTTTSSAATSSYDAASVARVGVRVIGSTEAGSFQLSDVREQSAAPSAATRSRGTALDSARNATKFAPSGQQYSVGFEMQLDVADFGRRRNVHFNRANEALDEALRADPDFAAQMESMIPGIADQVGSAGRRQNPVGWTWHHAESSTTGGRLGVMQLVPTPQHAPGSIFQGALHPSGAGGYAEWAIPNGAPKK